VAASFQAFYRSSPTVTFHPIRRRFVRRFSAVLNFDRDMKGAEALFSQTAFFSWTAHHGRGPIAAS